MKETPKHFRTIIPRFKGWQFYVDLPKLQMVNVLVNCTYWKCECNTILSEYQWWYFPSIDLLFTCWQSINLWQQNRNELCQLLALFFLKLKNLIFTQLGQKKVGRRETKVDAILTHMRKDMKFGGFGVLECACLFLYTLLKFGPIFTERLANFKEFNRSGPLHGFELSWTWHIFYCSTALCCSVVHLFLLYCECSPLLVCWKAREAVWAECRK